MIKVFQLVSHDKPVAEIRTDGRRYETFDDKTQGLADKLASGDFRKLQQRLSRTSYLKLVLKQDQLPGVLRYMLDSGDVAEVTTDGKTALLNGNMLSEQEKMQLMAGIANGTYVVTHKQSIVRPSPIHEEVKQPPAYAGELDTGRAAIQGEWKQAAEDKKNLSKDYNADYDPSIDGMDVDGLEWPEHARSLAYGLRYGKFPGES